MILNLICHKEYKRYKNFAREIVKNDEMDKHWMGSSYGYK